MPSFHYLLRLTLLTVLLLTPAARAHQAPHVLVTIKPIFSLVDGVMDGVGTPELLIPAGASPHDYALRPSDRRKLDRADLVIQIGPQLESFLQKIFANQFSERQLISLVEIEGLDLYPVRSEESWRRDTHATHEHVASIDPHLWLDPVNAQRIVPFIATRLADIDPHNAAQYRDNAENMIEDLKGLDDRINQRLSSVRDTPYVVAHDAYQYFEKRYQLNSLGAISDSHGNPPGVKTLINLRRSISASESRCVFGETPSAPAVANAVLADGANRYVRLDVMGTELPADPLTYEALMRAITDSLANCLSQ